MPQHVAGGASLDPAASPSGELGFSLPDDLR